MEASFSRMPPRYLELAKKRADAKCPRHKQVEEFGYDFREWVSPFTKGACRLGGIALVLQDWASSEKLAGQVDPDIHIRASSARPTRHRR